MASLCLSVCCLLVTPCMSLSTDNFKVSTEKKHLFLNISVVERDLWIISFYFTPVGSAYGTREDRRIKYNGNANLRAGTNKIALLSVACGLPVCPFITFTFNLHLLILKPSIWLFRSLSWYRMLECIMRHGTLVLVVLLCFMGWMKDHETLLGRLGPIRYV